jgi:hypothetical protein
MFLQDREKAVAVTLERDPQAFYRSPTTGVCVCVYVFVCVCVCACVSVCVYVCVCV